MQTGKPKSRGAAASPQIRAAVRADVAAITTCVCSAYLHYIARVGRQPGPMLVDYERKLQTSRVFVAEHEGRVAGTVVITIDDGLLWLENIAVEPAAQGKGIGRALLEWVEEQAILLGFSEIHLYTHVSMVENQSIYERSGYVLYDRRWSDGFDRLFYRKVIST